MNLEEVREHQQRRPFRPFTLFLDDGRSATVDHSEVIFVSPDGDTVTVWEPPRHNRLIDLASIVEIAQGPKARRSFVRFPGRCPRLVSNGPLALSMA